MEGYGKGDLRLPLIKESDLFRCITAALFCHATGSAEAELFGSQDDCAQRFGYAKANTSWIKTYLGGHKPLVRDIELYDLCYEKDYVGAATPVSSERERPET